MSKWQQVLSDPQLTELEGEQSCGQQPLRHTHLCVSLHPSIHHTCDEWTQLAAKLAAHKRTQH